MTRTRRTIGAVVMVLAIAGIADRGAAASSEACSAATLTGAYGFSISGTNYASDVAWALVGQFTGDGSGEFNGTGTQSVKGKIGRVKFTGTYEVKADCSGAATLQFTGGPAAAIDFVIVDGGQEIHLIVADNGTLETGVAKRVFASAPAAKSSTASAPRR